MKRSIYNQKHQKLHIIYFSMLFLFLGEIFGMLFSNEITKYIRFGTPIFISVLLFYEMPYRLKNNNVQSFWKNLILIYLILSFVTCISNTSFFSFGFTYRNFVNIILLLAPAYFFYVLSGHADKDMVYKLLLLMFWIYFFMLCIILFSHGISVQNIYDALRANIITDSDRSVESGYGLMFGFYALFFFHEKKYKLCVFTILLTLIGGKRIAIWGVIVSMLALYCINHHDIILEYLNKKVFKILFCGCALLLIYVWFLFYSDEFSALIFSITGMNTYQFTMGRILIGSSFFEMVPDKTSSLLGYGIGYIENVLYYTVGHETPFHNDFFRIYLEFGLIFFIIWILLVVKYAAINALAFSAFILFFFLIQTDNVLLYENVMYPFFLIILYSHCNQKEQLSITTKSEL
jgi:hypothetical protein